MPTRLPWEKFKRLPLGVRRAAAAAAKKLPYFKGKNFLLKCSERPEDYFFGQALVFPEDEASAVLQPAYENGPLAHELAAPFYARVKGQDEVTKKQYLDMNMWLPGDILLKADKMCMAHSLELRVPFLDKKVLEFAETVPVDYRIQGTDTKIVMRHAANKTLPDEWANRPKKGFPVPIRYWLREEKYYNIVKEYFTSDYAAVFFKPDALMKLLDDHFHERANNQRKIWTVLRFWFGTSASLWMRNNAEAKAKMFLARSARLLVRAAAGPAFILPLFSGMPQAAGLHRPARWLSWAARSGCCSQAGRIFLPHAAGHLPGGLCSGCRFVSYRAAEPSGCAGQAGARPVCGLGHRRPVSPAKGEIRRTPAPPKRRAFKRRGIFRFLPAARAAQNKKGAFHSRAPKGTGTYGK